MKNIQNAYLVDVLCRCIGIATTRSVLQFCFALAIVSSLASIALCCSIPVFRYALEHWIPEPFIVHIISSSPLDDSQKTLLKDLEELGKNANIRLKVSDGQNAKSDESISIVQLYSNRDSAWLAVETTKKVGGLTQVIWDAPFTKESVKQLLISPVRKRICEGLVEKVSVSWVFLETGDPTVDDAKFSRLESELLRLEGVIKLPEIDAADLKDLSKSPEELKIQFTAHRLSRSDPSEAAFVSMLLATESDLREEFDKGSPMAFPIFGRGRVLYALLGDGIAASTIEEASRFLAGACQCTVKADNPGVDMLVSFDWDEQVQITEPKKEEDVPLTGLGSFANRPKAEAPLASDAPGNPLQVGDTIASFDKVISIPSGTANDESSHPLVPQGTVVVRGIKPTSTQTNLPTSQSFTLVTLVALAAIVGSITIGWMFLFGLKS